MHMVSQIPRVMCGLWQIKACFKCKNIITCEKVYMLYYILYAPHMHGPDRVAVHPPSPRTVPDQGLLFPRHPPTSKMRWITIQIIMRDHVLGHKLSSKNS